MSGPYCRACRYFGAIPFDKTIGFCSDPAKAIYDRCGNRVTSDVEVHEQYTCDNFDGGEDVRQ